MSAMRSPFGKLQKRAKVFLHGSFRCLSKDRFQIKKVAEKKGAKNSSSVFVTVFAGGEKRSSAWSLSLGLVAKEGDKSSHGPAKGLSW